MLMNVPVVLVRMVEHVWTKSIPTTVPVQLDILVQTVKQVSIPKATYDTVFVYEETRMNQKHNNIFLRCNCNKEKEEFCLSVCLYYSFDKPNVQHDFLNIR